MRDYAGFDEPGSNKTALLIECGQHWEAAAGALAIESMLRFLVATGTLGQDALNDLSPPAPQRGFTVVEAVTIESETFTFTQSFTGGEIIAKKGTLIGHDGNRPIHTPADNTMLVMPSKRLWKGQTAVRLAIPDVQLASQ